MSARNPGRLLKLLCERRVPSVRRGVIEVEPLSFGLGLKVVEVLRLDELRLLAVLLAPTDHPLSNLGRQQQQLLVALDLALHLLVEIAFDFAHFSAAQAGHVDVVARAVAFVVVPVPVDVQQVQLVEQAQALEHFQGAIDGHAVDVGVNFLRALQDGVGAQVPFGLVHHFQQDPALARQAHAATFQRQAQPAGVSMGVDTLPGGDTLPIRDGSHRSMTH